MAITAGEQELSRFFEVEPVAESPDGAWPFNNFTYDVQRDGLALRCVLAPGYKDIRLVMKRGDARVYELNAGGVLDIRCQRKNDRDTLVIFLSEEDTVWLSLRPGFEIKQEFTAGR